MNLRVRRVTGASAMFAEFRTKKKPPAADNGLLRRAVRRKQRCELAVGCWVSLVVAVLEVHSLFSILAGVGFRLGPRLDAVDASLYWVSPPTRAWNFAFPKTPRQLQILLCRQTSY